MATDNAGNAIPAIGDRVVIVSDTGEDVYTILEVDAIYTELDGEGAVHTAALVWDAADGVWVYNNQTE